MLVAVAVVFVLAMGLSYAQAGAAKPMPEKVRAFLDKMTGTWERTDGGGQATACLEWDAGKGALIDRGTFREGDVTGSWSELWFWDATSKNGILSFVSGSSNQGFGRARFRGRVLSKTQMEGKKTGVQRGQEVTSKLQIEFKGANQVTWKETEVVVGGKNKPDIIETYTITRAGGDERELVRLQDEWCRAEMEGDAAALGRLLADEYVLVISNGTTLPRAQLLREVETGEGPFTATEVEDTKVKLYGNMAVVKGVVKWSDAGGAKHQSLFTETWQRRDGRWQCLATHESGEREIVAPEKTPGYQKMKRFVGDWTYEGHTDSQWEGTPFGPTGKFSGQFQARFVLNGNFVEEHWAETYEAGGALGGIFIHRYDADTGNIVTSGFQSDGTQYDVVYAIDGNTMTADFKQTGADGRESLVKAVWEYGPNLDTFTSTWKLSLDEGKTWKCWITYEAKKRGN